MTSDQFIYWLQGALELGNVKTMDETQVQVLKDHLALVLTKVTPTQIIPFIQTPNLTTPPYTITCSSGDTKMCSPLVCDSTASTLECSSEKSQLRDFTPEEKDRARELIAKMGEFNKKARSNGSNW